MSGSELSTINASQFLALKPLPEALEKAAAVRVKLDQILFEKIPKYTSEDTSLVVFGSLARGEWTSASDLDWTYLIDGQANSDHLVIAQKMQTILKDHEAEFRPPGQTGTFGNMAFSHDIIHQIGGQNDTNKNTTQRILLLLESASIGKNVQAYERVTKGVINRYLEEDNHLLTEETAHDTACRVFSSMTSFGSGEPWPSTSPVNSVTEPVRVGVYEMRNFVCLVN